MSMIIKGEEREWHSSGQECEMWQITVKLRFVWAPVENMCHVRVRKLQQLWVSDKGNHKWEDVEGQD